MENNNVNSAEPMNVNIKEEQMLPAKVTTWTKIKNFLFQEVKIELTAKQQKVLKEVHDFWNQEITWKKIKDFWLQDIEITL